MHFTLIKSVEVSAQIQTRHAALPLTIAYQGEYLKALVLLNMLFNIL